MMLKKGYVQIYTGDGKGKTTAATGLIVRALSRGLKACLVRFLKGDDLSGECALLDSAFDNVTIIATGSGEFIIRTPSPHDVSESKRAMVEAKKAVTSGAYDLVVLDEVNVALELGLVELDDLLSIIDEKPETVELVLTGRGAKDEVIDRADLVTEMKKVKHYYDKGVAEREGIEK